MCDLGIALCDEYQYRYGKRHKSLDVIEWALFYRPNLPTYGDITPFALAMPDECKVNSAVESYRTYYIMHKKSLGIWKNREQPDWFKI